jgi:hypothetical protein
MKQKLKTHFNDYIVVKRLIKNCLTTPLYKVDEYTKESIEMVFPEGCLDVPISECSLEDCVKSINEILIPRDKYLSKHKRRHQYDEHYDAKLLSVKLIRVKTTIEETVEDSISFKNEECSSVT